jgi:sulfur-carrier protein
MQIRVRFFAALRDALGMREQTLDLPGAATVASAWTALVALHPSLEANSSLAYAVNRAYADLGTVLHDGDELALIPPVSGG